MKKEDLLKKYTNVLNLLINKVLPILALAKQQELEEYEKNKELAIRIINVCTTENAKKYLGNDIVTILLKIKDILKKGELENLKKLEGALVKNLKNLNKILKI